MRSEESLATVVTGGNLLPESVISSKKKDLAQRSTAGNRNIFTGQRWLKMKEINNLVENFNKVNLTYMKLTPREDYNKISQEKDFMFLAMPGVCFIQVKGLSVECLQTFVNGYRSCIHRLGMLWV